MNRAGQQGDAVPAHLKVEVLAGHADPGGTRRAQDINVQVVPLLSRDDGVGSRHRTEADTPVLLILGW